MSNVQERQRNKYKDINIQTSETKAELVILNLHMEFAITLSNAVVYIYIAFELLGSIFDIFIMSQKQN